ncbi:MAG: hypothetical protein ACI3YG_00630 [Prevotella sp.]
MNKAIETIKINCKHGSATLVLTDGDEYLFRAYETARLFGFRDDRECIRNYSEDSKFVVMETNGGRQPVKCISIEDVARIAAKSRIPEGTEILYHLHIAQKDMEIKALKIQNLLLADDFMCLSDDLKSIREQIGVIFSEFGING